MLIQSKKDYLFNQDSIIYDLGGYNGDFTAEMYDRYKCNIYCFEPVKVFYDSIVERFKGIDKIKVFQLAVCDVNETVKFHIQKDSSGISDSGEANVECVTFDKILKHDFVDLVKMNIEGAEYALLEDMIEKDLIRRCGNIQVHFHKLGNYQVNYDNIRKHLGKTHKTDYYHSFVWENWKTKTRSEIDFWTYKKTEGVINKEHSSFMLLRTKEILNKHNIPFLLIGGTLLGAYRDGDFIEYDKDMDIAFFDDKRIINIIESGEFARYGIKVIREKDHIWSLLYENDYLDLYFYTEGKEYYECDTLRLPKEFMNSNTEIEFLGVKFKTVSDIEKYFVYTYGNDWKEHIPNKHKKR